MLTDYNKKSLEVFLKKHMQKFSLPREPMYFSGPEVTIVTYGEENSKYPIKINSYADDSQATISNEQNYIPTIFEHHLNQRYTQKVKDDVQHGVLQVYAFFGRNIFIESEHTKANEKSIWIEYEIIGRIELVNFWNPRAIARYLARVLRQDYGMIQFNEEKEEMHYNYDAMWSQENSSYDYPNLRPNWSCYK